MFHAINGFDAQYLFIGIRGRFDERIECATLRTKNKPHSSFAAKVLGESTGTAGKREACRRIQETIERAVLQIAKGVEFGHPVGPGFLLVKLSQSFPILWVFLEGELST